MQPRVCFLHIPKTAGSSVRTFFRDLYGDFAFHAHTTLDYQVTSDTELARYRFYAGHAYRSDWVRLPVGTRFLTILREPVDRLISLYRYWNAIDLDYLEGVAEPDQFLIEGIRVARACPIEQFAVSDSAAIVEHLRSAYARQLIANPTTLNEEPDGLSVVGTFDQAIEALFSFDAVLTTERLGRSFASAIAHLGVECADAHLPQENVSHTPLRCNETELRRIMGEISPLDSLIYAVARQLEARFL